jgi:hypothetical protein
MLATETTIATSTQTNALFWYYGTGNDSSTNFVADGCIYVSNIAAINNVEMDFDQYNATLGRLFSFGHQYHIASGCWQYANNSSGWQNTTACPAFAGNTWHHVIWTGHRVNGDTSCSGVACDYIDSVTQDGVTYAINETLPSETLGALPTALIDQFQINAGPTTGTPATPSYSLENIYFSAYNPSGTPTINAPTGLLSVSPF